MPQQCLFARVPAAIVWLKRIFHINAEPVRKRGVHGAHEISNEQCFRRRSNVLSGGNGMGDRQAPRRGNGYFRLGCTSGAWAVGAVIVTYGLEAANSHAGSKDGILTGMYFFLGSVARLSAAGDVRMLVRGGVSGAQRIARHLRRMCFALFIAAGSFFLGQPQVFPAALRKTNLLFIPAFLPLLLMIFWLFRVRFTNAYQGKSTPRGGDVYSLPI